MAKNMLANIYCLKIVIQFFFLNCLFANNKFLAKISYWSKFFVSHLIYYHYLSKTNFWSKQKRCQKNVGQHFILAKPFLSKFFSSSSQHFFWKYIIFGIWRLHNSLREKILFLKPFKKSVLLLRSYGRMSLTKVSIPLCLGFAGGGGTNTPP